LQAKIQRDQPCLHRNPALRALACRQYPQGHSENRMRHSRPISAPCDASRPSNAVQTTAGILMSYSPA
jgi:hypothetical protein